MLIMACNASASDELPPPYTPTPARGTANLVSVDHYSRQDLLNMIRMFYDELKAKDDVIVVNRIENRNIISKTN